MKNRSSCFTRLTRNICLATVILVSSAHVATAMAASPPVPDNQINANQKNLPVAPLGNGPTANMQQAQQELKEAGKEFSSADPGKTANKPSQNTGHMPLSDIKTTTAPQQVGSSSQEPPDGALQGSPQTGYAGTWTDPANGDVVTSVIAPTPQPSQQQAYPIIIEPQISDWNSSSGSGWNQNWSQWPGYPGDPGYPPPPHPGYTPPPAGFIPPYPGQGFNPPPVYPPPSFNPNYRPLRPRPPAHGGWQPGVGKPPIQPPQKPGAPNNPGGNWQPAPPPPHQGWQPGPTPAPGVRPGPSNPSIWQPGTSQLPGTPGYSPPAGRPPQTGFPANPGFHPLPLKPAGNTWGSAPNQGRPGGVPMFPRGGY